MMDIPDPPPILRDIFPKTAATIRLTPPQAVAFVELLVKHLNGATKLPLQARITKRSPLKLTIQVDINPLALESADPDD
jgi:hypothetical protein